MINDSLPTKIQQKNTVRQNDFAKIKKMCRSFYEKFTYISYKEFFSSLHIVFHSVLNSIEKKNIDEIYVLLNEDESIYKSSFWVLMNLMPEIYKYKDIISFTSLQEINNLHLDRRITSVALIYLDDGVYSGQQLIENTEALCRKIQNTNNYLYVCVTHIGEQAYQKLRHPKRNIIIVDTIKIMPVITSYTRSDFSDPLAKEYVKRGFCVNPENCLAFYFQHKMADEVSLPRRIIQEGYVLVLIKGKYELGTYKPLINECAEKKDPYEQDCPEACYKYLTYYDKRGNAFVRTPTKDTLKKLLLILVSNY